MIFPSVMAWLYFVAAAPGPSAESEQRPIMQVLYVVGKVIQFALPVVCWTLTDPRRLVPSTPNRRGWWPAALFGAGSAAGIVATYFGLLKGHALLAEVPEQVLHKVTELGIAAQLSYIAFAVLLCLVHSLLEEYYWRGFAFDGLRRWLPLRAAVIISSLAFASHHVIVLNVYTSGRWWTGTLPLALGVMVGGAVWALIYRRSGSIYSCWLSHALVDAGIMIVGYDMVFNT